MKCQECDEPLNESEIAEVNVIAQHCTPDLTCNKCLHKYRHLTHNNMLTEIQQSHYGLIEVNNKEQDVVVITNVQVDPGSGERKSEVLFIERNNLPSVIASLQNCIQ